MFRNLISLIFFLIFPSLCFAQNHGATHFGSVVLDAPLVVTSGGTGNATGDVSALTVRAPGAANTITLSQRLGYQLRPEDFNASGNGVSDDTIPVQNWLNAVKLTGGEGGCKGVYRLTSGINGFASASPGYHIRGDSIDGCVFLIDFSGWGLAGIDLTNPSSPSTSNRGFRSEWDHFSIRYKSGIAAPPIGFRARYATDLKLHDFSISQYSPNRGTCLSTSANFNTEDIANGHLWGCGGNVSAHLAPSGLTFSIVAASTTLSSSAAFFSAADVGTSFMCLPSGGGNYAELFTVSAYTDAQHVTVSRAASQSHPAATCAASGVTGSMTSGSNQLTLNVANVSAAFIGSTVYVEAAGATTISTAIDALRATITGVAGNVLTLSANASTSVAGAQIIFNPAWEIYPESDSSPNDVVATDIHNEEFSGTGLVVQDCAYCRFPSVKLAALDFWGTFGQTNFVSQFNAALFSSDTYFDGADIEGTPVNGRGQILVEGLVQSIAFVRLTGVVKTGIPAISLYHNAYGSAVSVFAINSNAQYDPAWGASLLHSDGTSGNGFAFSGGIGAYNTAWVPPSGAFGTIFSSVMFQGVSSALNYGDVIASARFNSYQGWSIKNSQGSGQTWINLGNDQSNQAGWLCLQGSTGSNCNGPSTLSLFGKYGLWLSGGVAAGTGLQSDTSGNFIEHGNLTVTGLTQLSVQGSAPATCNGATKGAAVLASAAGRICVCNGAAWIFDYNAAACTW